MYYKMFEAKERAKNSKRLKCIYVLLSMCAPPQLNHFLDKITFLTVVDNGDNCDIFPDTLPSAPGQSA